MISGLLSLGKVFGKSGFLGRESGTGIAGISSTFSANERLGDPGKVVLVRSGTGDGVLERKLASMNRGYRGIVSGLVCISISRIYAGSSENLTYFANI